VTPIHDRSGQVCAWLDGQVIRDLRGRVTAFVSGSQVVGMHRQHVGSFQDGNIRDRRGAVVGWVEGATGGPIKPIPSVPPVPPIGSVPPIPPIPPIAPIPPIGSPSWSAMTWQQFIQQ
jgi:hypothetical protein